MNVVFGVCSMLAAGFAAGVFLSFNRLSRSNDLLTRALIARNATDLARSEPRPTPRPAVADEFDNIVGNALMAMGDLGEPRKRERIPHGLNGE